MDLFFGGIPGTFITVWDILWYHSCDLVSGHICPKAHSIFILRTYGSHDGDKIKGIPRIFEVVLKLDHKKMNEDFFTLSCKMDSSGLFCVGYKSKQG